MSTINATQITDERTQPIYFSKFILQSVLTTIGAFIALVAFCYLRSKNGMIYGRRHKYVPLNLRFVKSTTLNVFNLLKIVYKTSEQEILQKVGLDALTFLKYCKLQITYMTISMLFGIILVPVNYFGGTRNRNIEINKLDLSAFSLTNLETSSYLWFHITISWLSAFILFYLLYKNNIYFIGLRQQYFLSEEYLKELHNRTIIFTHLAEQLRDVKKLNSFLEGLNLQAQFSQSSISRKVDPLPQLMKKYNNTVVLLENSINKYIQTNERPLIKTKLIGGRQFDAINSYSQDLMDLGNEIILIRKHIDNLPKTSIAFVSFPDVFSAHLSMRELEPGLDTKLLYDGPKPKLSIGMNPNDIIWTNLNLSKRTQRIRNLLTYLLFLVILIFGIFPLGWIAGLANMNNVVSTFPFLNFLQQSPTTVTIVETCFSPLFLMIYMRMMQQVLRKLSEYQSTYTFSGVERKLLTKFYLFNMIDSFFFFSISSSFFQLIARFKKTGITSITDLLPSISDNIKAVAQLFVEQSISSSSFWVNQISLRTLVYVFELVQVVSLIKIYASKYLMKATKRQKHEFLKPNNFDYPIVYAIQIFNFTILITFSIPAPLIIPFGLFNFLVAYFVFKHHLMYVYVTRSQTGGRMWKTVFNRIMVAIIFSHFFHLIIYTVKGANALQWIVALPLPFLTIVLAFSHSTWLHSHLDYIALDAYATAKGYDPTSLASENKIDFNSQFHHPGFSNGLLALKLDDQGYGLLSKDLIALQNAIVNQDEDINLDQSFLSDSTIYLELKK